MECEWYYTLAVPDPEDSESRVHIQWLEFKYILCANVLLREMVDSTVADFISLKFKTKTNKQSRKPLRLSTTNTNHRCFPCNWFCVLENTAMQRSYESLEPHTHLNLLIKISSARENLHYCFSFSLFTIFLRIILIFAEYRLLLTHLSTLSILTQFPR